MRLCRCDAVNQLRQLYINVGGSVDLDIPEELTVEKMCQATNKQKHRAGCVSFSLFFGNSAPVL